MSLPLAIAMPLGGWELLLILVIVMIVFGVGKLPDAAGAIGRGIREFRRGQSGDSVEKQAEAQPENKES